MRFLACQGNHVCLRIRIPTLNFPFLVCSPSQLPSFLNGGNVGIGTSSPASKLDVNGVITALGGNSPTGGFNLRNVAGTVTPRMTNDAADATVIRTGASGGSIKFNNFANTAENLICTDAGNLGLGVTPSAWSLGKAFEIGSLGNAVWSIGARDIRLVNNVYYASSNYKYASTGTASMLLMPDDGSLTFSSAASGSTGGTITFSQRFKVDDAGNFSVGKSAIDTAVAGAELRATGFAAFTRSADISLLVNRLTDDGTLVSLRQASTEEGTISVSGTTVSYNGGHLSRWAQMLTTPELFKGTVMSNLDEMNVYTKDGQPVANEQLNKVKVSDTEGDVNVAGVFVNWSHDEDHNVDEINMAMTGDMIIKNIHAHIEENRQALEDKLFVNETNMLNTVLNTL